MPVQARVEARIPRPYTQDLCSLSIGKTAATATLGQQEAGSIEMLVFPISSKKSFILYLWEGQERREAVLLVLGAPSCAQHTHGQ